MTVIGRGQAKAVRDTLALARARAGKIQAFDVAAAQLDPAARGLALREAGHQLRQADEQLIELKAVAEALRQLEQAGAYRAVVLEVCTGGGLPGTAAYLALIGQPTQIVAGLLPGVDPASLRPGDEVEVVRSGPDQFAVRRRVDRHVRYGVVARVDRVERPDLLRVTLGSDSFYLRSSSALAAEIESVEDESDILGRFVSFEPQLGMAFGFFGEPEREGLVLREVPSRVSRSVPGSTATLSSLSTGIPDHHEPLDVRRHITLQMKRTPPTGLTRRMRRPTSRLSGDTAGRFAETSSPPTPSEPGRI